MVAQAKASFDIAALAYIDNMGRNNVERKHTIGSQKVGLAKQKVGSLLKSEIIFDFMVAFASYGLFPSVNESVLKKKQQRLLPKLIHEYFVKSASKDGNESETKAILNRAIDALKKERFTAKNSGVFSGLSGNFSTARSDNPSILEIVLLVHVLGTLKIRGACKLADEEEVVASGLAKNELGGVELYLRTKDEAAPVSCPFKGITDDGDETEPQAMTTARVHVENGRSLVKTCGAVFKGETYAREMIVPASKVLALPRRMDNDGDDDDDGDNGDGSNKRPSESVEEEQGNRKKQKTSAASNSDDKIADEVDEEKTVGRVTVATEELAGSTGNDEDDENFIADELMDLFSFDLSKVAAEKRKQFMERMREWFRCKEDDILMNDNEEEEHELLQGLIAGDTAAKPGGKTSSDMEGVLMAALRNARMRETFNDDFIDKSDVLKYTKPQMKKIKAWKIGTCTDENKTAREKVESFAENLEIRVRLISAIGNEWTENTYGPTNPEKYAVTILAKNDDGEDITNDQTTTYKYYVRKRLNE